MTHPTTILDKPAVRQVSAGLILRNGKKVGKWIAHYGQSTVTVTLWDWTPPNTIPFGDKVIRTTQSAKASGYGYDKFTACLAGMTFGGIELFDHSVRVTDKRKTKGTHLANGGKDRFYDEGLNRLRAFGYDVIPVL